MQFTIPDIILALAGLAGTVLVCRFAPAVARTLGTIDLPDGKRKFHDRPTPLVGGLAITLSIVAIGGAFATKAVGPLYVVLFAVSLALALLGVFDDRGNIRASYRLLISLAIFAVILLALPFLQITYLRFSFVPRVSFVEGWSSLAFTLICLLGLQNSLNMMDGRNGLAIGTTMIWSGVLLGHAPDHLKPFLLVLLAALTITLWFNMTDRLFLGDAGTYVLSGVLGLVAIYVYNVNFAAFPSDAVALLFLIPVLDCLRLIARRVARGTSPFKPDNTHFHHMLDQWVPWRWGLLIYLSIIAIPNLVAFAMPSLTIYLIAMTILIYAAVILVAKAHIVTRRESTN